MKHGNRYGQGFDVDSSYRVCTLIPEGLETPCWSWSRGIGGNGYGQFGRNGKAYRADRYFFEKAGGKISADEHLFHLCQNRRCVNPEHLKAMSRSDLRKVLTQRDPLACYAINITTGCWRWTGPVSSGYAVFKKNNVTIMAAQFFYEQQSGPLPDGHRLLHLCEDKICVNPEHKKAMTLAETLSDRAMDLDKSYRIEATARPGCPSPCWIWLRASCEDGYGRLWEAGRLTAPYRVFYEHRFGPIPKGLHIDHLCANTTCVNPDHLEAVTLRENTRRGGKPHFHLRSPRPCTAP